MFRLIKVQLLASFVFVALLAFGHASDSLQPTPSKPAPPATGKIVVAFVLSEHAQMIDFAGPWEVFQDVMVPSRGPAMADQHVFELYTVSDNVKPLRTSGGMQVIPDYTFDNAPQPTVVVVPAQMGDSRKMLDWLRKMATRSDVVMSVCTGAFKLAEAGLLNGKNATTHHGAYVQFEHEFPDVRLQRNRRYVQSDRVIYTAGGLSAGIDLALHIVDLYFGREIAEATARTMEYEGQGWRDGAAMVTSQPHSNPSDQYTNGVLGNWEGKLKLSEGTFRVAVHIWPDKSGALTGTVDSLDQDDYGRKISSATFKNSVLHFEVASVGGSFDGILNKDQTSIKGAWLQHGISAPLAIERISK